MANCAAVVHWGVGFYCRDGGRPRRSWPQRTLGRRTPSVAGTGRRGSSSWRPKTSSAPQPACDVHHCRTQNLPCSGEGTGGCLLFVTKKTRPWFWGMDFSERRIGRAPPLPDMDSFDTGVTPGREWCPGVTVSPPPWGHYMWLSGGGWGGFLTSPAPPPEWGARQKCGRKCPPEIRPRQGWPRPAADRGGAGGGGARLLVQSEQLLPGADRDPRWAAAVADGFGAVGEDDGIVVPL